jgi:hypothetical protein
MAQRSLFAALFVVALLDSPLSAQQPNAVAPVPVANQISPPSAARIYLEAMEVSFTTNSAGEVVEAIVHCTSDLTDADVALFRHFPKLEKLNIVGTEVTDAGLAHLKDLPELKDLSLYRDHFTEVGMSHLKELRKLRRLSLTRSEPTDKGLEQLAGVKTLENLVLPGNKVTARGLDHLKKLPALQALVFRGSRFTDADAKSFAGFPKLTRLQVGMGDITPDGLKAIRDGLPGVTVGH